MFGNFFGMNNNNNVQIKKTKNRLEEIEVSLESIYNEKKLKVSYKKDVLCRDCNASGAKDKNKITTCNICNGSGNVIKMQQLGPGFYTQTQSQCSKCYGKGKIITEDNICPTCKGNKVVKKVNYLHINLKKDTRHGQNIVYHGESDQHPDADEYGDFIIKILIKKHTIFDIKDEKHLYLVKKINLKQALCGFEFTIEHLDKQIMYLSVDSVIKPFSKKIIRGKGLGGDMIIEFDVVFPEK